MNTQRVYWQAFADALPEDDAMVMVFNKDIRRLVARLVEMEDQITEHRFKVGEAYHNGTDRAIHAANTKLWRLIK